MSYPSSKAVFIRGVFAAAALVATLATGGFIDHLAKTYAGAPDQLAKAPTVLAAAKR